MAEPGSPLVPKEFSHGYRFTMISEVSFSAGFTFSLIPQTVWNVYFIAEEESLYRNDFGFKVLVHDGGASIDLTPWVRTGNLSQSVSQAASFNIVMGDDQDRYLRPFQESGDDLYQIFNGANFDDNWNITKYMEILFYTAGRTWYSPYLLPSDAEWALDNTGEKVLRVSGSDLTEILVQEDQQHADYITTGSEEDDTGGIIQNSASILSSIAGIYGITLHNTVPGFPVRQFSPKGLTGIDYFKQLLYVTQGTWRFDRDTLVLEPVKWTKNGGASWKFVDVLDIKNIQYKMSIQELKNEFVINKVEKGGEPLAQVVVDKYGITDYIELRVPSLTVDIKVLDANYGGVNTFTYWDAQKRPIQTTPGQYRGGIKAKYVTFVYYPVINSGVPQTIFNPDEPNRPQYANGRPPRAEVEFWGMSRAGGLGDLDLGYKVWYRAPNQATFGRRRDRNPIENPLIPNKSYAIALATALAEASLRTTQISNWEGILNPWVIPNRTISLVCGQAGFTSPTNFYVEKIDKQFDAEGNFTMRLECSGDQA